MTPEEKLLKLIKKEEVSPQKNEEKKEEHVAAAPFLKVAFSDHTTRVETVKIFSYLGGALALLLLSILGYQYLIREPVLPLPLPRMAGSETLELPTGSSKLTESFDTYAKIFQGRNVFKSMGPPPSVSVSREKVVGLSDLVKNLTLSGIIDGEPPEAIIEDKSTGQLYYVEKGGTVGSLEVVEVREGHVILRYGDEEGQLTL
ncbi:MAG: hypothetical protein HYS08_05555 [Chlamydiae bacterium]|nr:hypothetical protein [Chlamydiota bacterium]MBI3267183.1 hypothetical protein [Chlamydiota bacterium]